MRTVIAFLLAPLATMTLAAFAPSDWGFFAFLTVCYAYPLMLIAGVPSYLYFRRKGWLKLWQVVSAGVIVGVVVPTLLAISSGLESLLSQAKYDSAPPDHLVSVLALPLLGAVLGAAIALVFWLIAIGPSSRVPHGA